MICQVLIWSSTRLYSGKDSTLSIKEHSNAYFLSVVFLELYMQSQIYAERTLSTPHKDYADDSTHY